MEYIIGKWYKGFRDTDKVACKFLRSSGEYFYFSEFIRKSTGYNIYNGNWSLEYDIIECCISEIQQYLPKNHPDLLPQEPNYEIY